MPLERCTKKIARTESTSQFESLHGIARLNQDGSDVLPYLMQSWASF